jgi:hypothetical protein
MNQVKIAVCLALALIWTSVGSVLAAGSPHLAFPI